MQKTGERTQQNSSKIFTEAEQFVFISEQSSQFFVKFSTKYLQHRLKKNGGKFKPRLHSHSNLTTLGILV